MLRRTTAILATTGALALGFVPQAGAQDPGAPTYGAGAQATALQISLLDQFQAAFSVTGAAVTGEPAKAAANGAAALITGASEDLTSAATPGTTPTAQSCVADEALPPPINLAGIELACVDMTTDAGPTGHSVSKELGLTVTSADAVQQVTDALAPVLDQILAGLQPVLTQIDPTATVAALVDDVLANLDGGTTLATIQLAPSSSDASKITGRGEAKGVGPITLLPDLTLDGADLPDLAVLTVGDAFAQATYDAATGQVVTDGKAAFLTVDLAGLQALVDALVADVQTLIEALPIPPEVTGAVSGSILGPVLDGVTTLVSALDTQIEANVNVVVDQLACGDANPLTPVLCFTAGGVRQLDAAAAKALGYDFGPTTKGIQAQVLGLALLSAAGDSPVLGLRVGGASAAAASAPAALSLIHI